MILKSYFSSSALDILKGHGLALLVDVYIYGVDAGDHKFWGFLELKRSVHVQIAMGLLLYSLIKPIITRWWRSGEKKSVYGLQHGRLHVQAPTAMWMNMGYWKAGSVNMTLAVACRDLLKVVLAEAGFEREKKKAETEGGVRQRRCWIDLGFGCGDQTVYLMSDDPVRSCDKEWWDERESIASGSTIILASRKMQSRLSTRRSESMT
jgi:hypothetical protein